MKGRVLGLAVLLLVLGSAVPFCVAEKLPRHRDPLDFGPEQPNLVSLENLYGFVFNRTMTENYPVAFHWLDVAELVFAPQDTKAVMDRFTSYFRSVVGDLNVTKSDIELIKGYVRHLKMSEAKASVAAALVRLDGTNVTVGSMDVTAAQLASILKGSPKQMLEGDAGLRTLIDKYRLDLLALLLQVENAENPPPPPDIPPDEIVIVKTRLLISVSPRVALVGSSVRVWGNLTDANGAVLSSRSVDVYIDNDLVERVVTDGSGSFDMVVGLPYVYKDHVTFSAEYLGEVAGNTVYVPCSSNEVQVKLIYYTPVISVTMPRVVYPGRSFLVNGSVAVDGVGVAGLGVTVSVFGSTYGLVSDVAGGFALNVSVPAYYPEGVAGVGVYSSPRGVYGPSDFLGFVDVVRVPLTLSIASSSWAVSGLPFKVSGSVLLDGVPVENCTVRLGGGVGDSVVATNANGTFESEVGLPFSLFTADYPFNVKAYASEPWVRDSSVSGRVFVVNIVSLVAVPLIVGGVVYVGYRRLRRPRRRAVLPPPMEDGAVAVPVAVAQVEGGPLGVREAYGSALELVVRRSGVSPKPSMTLREYLAATRGKLGAGERVFRSLTMMFERWLYGGSEVKLSIVDRLLLRIRKLFG